MAQRRCVADMTMLSQKDCQELVDERHADYLAEALREASIKQHPAAALVLQTGVTTIGDHTSAEQAREWLEELEALYDTYFDDRSGGPVWTWYETHPTDHAAFLELSEVIRAAAQPPLCAQIVTQFRTFDWRHAERQVLTQTAHA